MASTWTSSQPSCAPLVEDLLGRVHDQRNGRVLPRLHARHPIPAAPARPGATVAVMSDDPEILSRHVRPPDRTEVTGPEATDVYDVWEPEPHRARSITVALVHGGFWRERYDRAHLAPLAEALTRDGFHVANLEYPRTGMPGGGWPGTAAAVLARLGSVHEDTDLPDSVVAVGHSAGGHLVLWAASRERAPWLRGVVALAPVADLLEADRLHLGDDAARALLGGLAGRGARCVGRGGPRAPAAHHPRRRRHRRSRRRRPRLGGRARTRPRGRMTNRCTPRWRAGLTTSTSSTRTTPPTSCCSQRSRSSPCTDGRTRRARTGSRPGSRGAGRPRGPGCLRWTACHPLLSRAPWVGCACTSSPARAASARRRSRRRSAWPWPGRASASSSPRSRAGRASARPSTCRRSATTRCGSSPMPPAGSCGGSRSTPRRRCWSTCRPSTSSAGRAAHWSGWGSWTSRRPSPPGSATSCSSARCTRR